MVQFMSNHSLKTPYYMRKCHQSNKNLYQSSNFGTLKASKNLLGLGKVMSRSNQEWLLKFPCCWNYSCTIVRLHIKC